MTGQRVKRQAAESWRRVVGDLRRAGGEPTARGRSAHRADHATPGTGA